MERQLIHQMFSRSLASYNVRYIAFIGDGDAKVHRHLLDNPPYVNLQVKKIEDVNHFAKRMLSRINKVKLDYKGKVLSDGKKFTGKGRMTDSQAVKFKIYFAKAIRENRLDLESMYQRSWAIFNHRYSTNDEPMHDWCDPKWCRYLQAVAEGETFDHALSSTPRPCLDLIRPIFEELCSRESLQRVVYGDSQNANEAFHSLVWTMVPKHRYCSSTILRIGIGLSTIVYNDGYASLNHLFSNIFGAAGHYTTICFNKLDSLRAHTASKEMTRKKRRKATATTTASNNTNSNDHPLHSIEEDGISHHPNEDLDLSDLIEGEEDDAYEPGGDE